MPPKGASKSRDKRIKVKICGITNLPDALCAQNFGADALGFVFYPKSPRYISSRQAQKIIQRLKKSIKKIGVFVNPKVSHVRRIAELCGLDMLQFHGDEAPEFCRYFSGYKVIKSFRVKNKASLKSIGLYKGVDFFLFDAFKKGLLGGTGAQFRWGLLKDIHVQKPFFLSGGLCAGNVGKAIKCIRPDWIDVSSGLEISPGRKDAGMLRKFIERAKKHGG